MNKKDQNVLDRAKENVIKLSKHSSVKAYLHNLETIKKVGETIAGTQPVEVVTPFEEIIERTQSQIRQLLIVKGKEYVRNGDPFHNFHRGAEMNRESAPRSLHGYLGKHIVNYLDMLDDIDNGKKFTAAQIKERFGDMLTYIHLQEALFLLEHSSDYVPTELYTAP